jgi:acetyl esterase/lipase
MPFRRPDDADHAAPDARVDITGPSIRMSLLKLVLRFNGVKRTFGSAERTEEAIAKKGRAGAARRPGRLDRRFRIRSSTFGGLTTVSIEPRTGDLAGPSIAYLPGNAYVYPLMRSHWSIVEALATDSQTRVHMVHYPVAPQAGARTVVPAVADLVEELAGAEGQAPVLAGDSAGAGLAVAAAQHLSGRHGPLPAHLLLLSPWLDVTMANVDPAAASSDPILAVPGLLHAARLWARDLPLTASEVSPIHGEMRGLCPVTVIAGTDDLLYPDAARLEALCRESGVDFSMLVASGAFHVFVAATALPETRAARRHIGARIHTSAGRVSAG